MVRVAKTSASRQRSATRRGALDLPIKARRHRLVAAVERQLIRCGVLTSNPAKSANVVVAVSGGADSVALLLACAIISGRNTADRSPLRLTAVHVHHHLRQSADADASYVRDLCRRLGVRCTVEHVHPARLNGNTSAHARDLRYAALIRQARRHRARSVLTAHHADDQFETMLMALCRGAGIDGLSGMAPARPLSVNTVLVRPLLESSKAECQSLCGAAGIRWREDPTNHDVTRLRARLRSVVIPVLERLWPGCATRTATSARLLCDSAEAIDAMANAKFGLPSVRRWRRKTLGELPMAVITTGLRRSALCLNPDIADDLNSNHLLNAAAIIRSNHHVPKQFIWPGGLVLKIDSTSVSLSKEAPGCRRRSRARRKVR